MQTLVPVPHHTLPPQIEAQLPRLGNGAPLPPGAGDTAESARVVGWTHAGDFCHVPIILAGAPCTALVTTGSTATLMRPDVVPAGTRLEPTVVKLRTVTGELAPMLGRGVVAIQVGGGLSVDVWVAEVQGSLHIRTGLPASYTLCVRPGGEHAGLSRGPHS